MPSKEAHLLQSQHNLQLAETLAKGKFADWAATAYFYAALHHVGAVLSVHGYSPELHDQRLSLMSKIPELKTVLPDFTFLKNLSRQARYDAQQFSAEDLVQAQRAYESIKTHLLRIGYPLP